MSFREALIPNGHITSQIRWILVGVTVAVLFGSWLMVPASSLLPSPGEVLGAFSNLMDQGLMQNLLMSWKTNIQAIGLSCLITIPLSYLTVVPAARPFVAALSKLRFLGMTGLVVAFTLGFGGGHGLKLALLTFGMGVFLITSLYDIVESIPREEFDHARTLRMGPWASVLEVVVLGHLDAVLDTVRQNAAMGWVMLSMVEGLVRFEGGLGAMMLAEDKHINLAAVFALQLTVLVVGIGQDYLLALFKRWFCPYAFITLERQ
ncbi:MAG: ABC transporter permease [Rhizomicrobium sp.]